MIEELCVKNNESYPIIMYIPHNKVTIQPTTFSSRQTKFIDRAFQVKYTSLIVVTSVASLLTFAIPLVYFFHQNYELFIQMAFDFSPGLVTHLERERSFIYLYLLIGLICVLSFFIVIGYKITAQVVAPVKILNNHLKFLCRGMWYQRPLKLRDNDEFLDLIETYNYFYRSYQKSISDDLHRLEKMNIDPENGDAYFAWRDLVDEKRKQLNIKKAHLSTVASLVTASVASPVKVDDSRHVS